MGPDLARRDSRLTAAIGSLRPSPGMTGERVTDPAYSCADGSDVAAYGDVRSGRYVVVAASPQTGANDLIRHAPTHLPKSVGQNEPLTRNGLPAPDLKRFGALRLGSLLPRARPCGSKIPPSKRYTQAR